jgi:hypothetical protein
LPGILIPHVSGTSYGAKNQQLLIDWPLGTIAVTGPKALEFYERFSNHRATLLRADGQHILSVRMHLNSERQRDEGVGGIKRTTKRGDPYYEVVQCRFHQTSIYSEQFNKMEGVPDLIRASVLRMNLARLTCMRCASSWQRTGAGFGLFEKLSAQYRSFCKLAIELYATENRSYLLLTDRFFLVLAIVFGV